MLNFLFIYFFYCHKIKTSNLHNKTLCSINNFATKLQNNIVNINNMSNKLKKKNLNIKYQNFKFS